MPDMRGPIRKLESRARHHQAIAALDSEAAEQAGDEIEKGEFLISSRESAEQASDYLAAVRILKNFQEAQRMIQAAEDLEVRL